MKMDYVRLYSLIFVKIVICVQAQVTFDPDPENDVQLNSTLLTVLVTTVQCYTSPSPPAIPPTIKVQYVAVDDNESLYVIYNTSNNLAVNGGSCDQGQSQYRATLQNLKFIADPILVGGTFKLKATVDGNEDNSTLSKTTYTFPAPFNLTGSSASAVLYSSFSWTCHATPDNIGLEWLQDSKSIVQVTVGGNGSCNLFSQDESYPYTYSCQRSPLTYTLTIPGSNLTQDLQALTWRCKNPVGEVKGSKFMILNIVVPVTNVSISPGSGSTLDVDEGQTVTFTCTTNSANPAPTILWFIGSTDVTSQAGSNRTTLTHNVIKAEHQMSVGCMAWNSGNQANLSDSTTLNVRSPFNLTGSSVSALLGSEFTWTCHVTPGYPIIEWYRDSTNLGQIGILNGTCVTFGQNDSYLYNCQRSAFTYTLTIPGSSLTEELQGSTWRCKDVTDMVKGSEFRKLDIVVPVTTVTMSPGGNGSTFNADENDVVTFTCTTNNANPPPTILWYIGSSDVTSMAGSNRTTLTLNVSREYHQMTVRCDAGNNGNTANLSDSSIFHVIFPPANNEELQITGYTSGQVLYENSAVMIDISCTQPGGNPVVNMAFKCGTQTGTNENTANEAIRKVSLTINRSLDGTQCICTSTHINGYMRNKSVTFTVYYPPSTPFISISSAFPWKANESQRLQCETTQGNPPATTFIWKEGGSILPITSQTYEFNPVQPTDNGRQLHCQVNNNFTLQQNVVMISDVTNLQVEYPPANHEELQITGYTSGQVLYENDPPMVSIYCRQPGGNPVVNMTFTCGSQTGTNGNTDTEAIRQVNLTNDRNLNGLQCVCTSTHINAYIRTKNVSFIVYYPPSTPIINLSSALPWKATGTYNLTCNRTPGNPADTVYTWKDGVSVSQITSQTYEFKPLNSTDNGRQLSCQVNNNFTLHKSVVLTSNVTTLQVEYDPDVTLDQSSVEVIEGHNAVLSCSATGNPLPTVTWYRDSTPVTESTISSSTYNITNASRTLTGYYTCKANSSSTGSNILQPDQKNTHLRVFYPPTVQIYLQNTTEDTENYVIRCLAAGDPNNSTIIALQQRIGSFLIRNITDFTESSPGNIRLNIGTVSYQDMGTYTCLASNGIPDRSKQKIQSNLAYFNVITSAKFKRMEYIMRFDVGTIAALSIPFYKNPPATVSDIMWINNTGASNETLVSSANVFLYLAYTDVEQTLYGVNVTLKGQSANMIIPTFQDYYEGNYTLKIRSSHADSAEVHIVLKLSGPPDTPSNFQLLARKMNSVVLTWNKGSDGGQQQTFVVLYRDKTAEMYNTKQIVDTTVNVTITDEIKHLKSDTNYELILYSFNKKGNSTGYKTLEERTLKAPVTSTPHSLNSGLVGGAVGGGVAVLVVVIVILVVMRRRQENDKETHLYQNQDRSFYTDLHFDRPTTNDEEERTAYTMLQFGEQHTYSNMDNVHGTEGGR